MEKNYINLLNLKVFYNTYDIDNNSFLSVKEFGIYLIFQKILLNLLLNLKKMQFLKLNLLIYYHKN